MVPRRRRIAPVLLGILSLAVGRQGATAEKLDFVAADKDCYDRGSGKDSFGDGDIVRIRFATAMPTAQNWVGILPHDDDQLQLQLHDDDASFSRDDAVAFEYACGSHDDECEHPGVAGFNAASIPHGRWVAVLEARGYHGSALRRASAPFTVADGPRGCAAREESNNNHNDSNNDSIEDFVRLLPGELLHDHLGGLNDDDHGDSGPPRYTTGQTIGVSFRRANPQPSDAMALYPVGATPTENSSSVAPLRWLYACGEASCPVPAGEGTLRFGTHGLASGVYRVALGRISERSGQDPVFEPRVLAPTPLTLVETDSCPTDVVPSKECYAYGEDIGVGLGGDGASFHPRRCDSAGDAIAIFALAATRANPPLEGPVASKPACTKCAPEEGGYSYGHAPPAGTWPPPPGLYRVALLRPNPGSDRPMAYHFGGSFEVAAAGKSCGESTEDVTRGLRGAPPSR